MCVCLAVLVQSWLIALQTEEAPLVSFAASSPSGSPELGRGFPQDSFGLTQSNYTHNRR